MSWVLLIPDDKPKWTVVSSAASSALSREESELRSPLSQAGSSVPTGCTVSERGGADERCRARPGVRTSPVSLAILASVGKFLTSLGL